MKRIEMKSSERFKATRRRMKAITIHSLCFALLYSPMTYGQQQQNEDGGLANALGTTLNIVKGTMQQMVQQRQQAMAQAQMQAMISSLQPQKVPSKFFPQCAVSKAVTDFPEGACEGPVTGPQDLAQIDAFKSLAVSYESFFENLTATNQNSPQPVGLQCLEEAAKKTDAQIQDKINALTALINKVKKETQAFEQEHRKIKEQMDITKDLLYGPIKNADVRATNLLTEFSGKCQDYFKNGGKNAIVQQGFTSLRDRAEQQRNIAADFTTNKDSYVKDLKNQLNNIRTEVGKTGVGIFANPDTIKQVLAIGGQTFKFGSAESIINATVAKFGNDFRVIQRDLADVGYNITLEDLDGEFNLKMTRFSKGAREFFTKQAISDCVTGKGTTGIGLSTDQILDGLRHRSLGGSSTALRSYKAALENILASDGFIEDKMSAISKLDKKYGVGEVFVQVAGSDAQSRTMTPYGLYQQQIAVCKQRINQDETFSTKEGLKKQSGSIAERIGDAERAMRKAIALENNFLNELTSGIFDRVVHCEGIEPNASRCDFTNGGQETFNTGDGQFCVAHASTCAQEVSSCYQEADVVVQKKQAEMKALAATFNERVSGLVAQQEFFLNQIKAQVVNDAEFIKRFIPGSSYQFPEDLFVNMPEEIMNNEYGVALRNGGDVTSLVNDLPKKLDSLKDMLDGQRNLVAKSLGDYLKDQQSGMERDRQKWSQLKEKCNGAIAQHNQQVAQQNKANAETQGKMAEARGEADTFCQKYNDAATNPAAGCGKADDLAKEVYEVSGSILNSADVRYAVQEFQYYCDSANNEGEDKESQPSSTEQDFEILSEKCDDGSGNPNISFLKDYLSQEIEKQMPEGVDSSDKQIITNLISNPDEGRNVASSLSSEMRESAYYRNVVEPYVKMIRNQGNISVTSLDLPEDGEFSEEFKKIVSDVNSGAGDVDVCRGYDLLRQRNAARMCTSSSNRKDGEDDIDCFKRRYDDYFSPDNNELKRAATVTSNVYNRVIASTSNRLGEQMLGTPCMAQQGFNGAQGVPGGPTGSPLDMTGWDIINQAMGK